MCRVNSWFKKYNTLFLSATVIHRTWLDKMNSKDYHFAKELRSTLSSYSKYERVKCNTDKLPNITALNMTVTRLPVNLASRTHNFPSRGIMCPWLSPITVSISSNQKSDFAEHTFFGEKNDTAFTCLHISLPPKTFNEALLNFRCAKWVQAWKPNDSSGREQASPPLNKKKTFVPALTPAMRLWASVEERFISLFDANSCFNPSRDPAEENQSIISPPHSPQTLRLATCLLCPGTPFWGQGRRSATKQKGKWGRQIIRGPGETCLVNSSLLRRHSAAKTGETSRKCLSDVNRPNFFLSLEIWSAEVMKFKSWYLSVLEMDKSVKKIKQDMLLWFEITL